MEVIAYIVLATFVLSYLYVVFFFKPKPKNEPLSPYELDILKCESPIEKRVYNGLIQHGLYSTPQYRVGKYRVDLAFPHQMIAIECDGKDFHSSPEQKAHDRRKDKFLRDRGWIVLRFTGSKIHRDLLESLGK